MRKLIFVLLGVVMLYEASAQISPCNCTASVSGNQNFSALTWTGSGCPTAGSTSYTGNLCVNLANGANLTMDKDFTINGGFGVSNTGSSTFTLPVNMQLSVTGSMGDDNNNNVSFVINGDLSVGGTFYGKNNNGFTGTGSITAGGLDFGNGTVCTNPANCSGIDWNVGTCQPSGSTFCNNVNALPVTLIYFEAKVNGQVVDLKWATATESNASYFAVERSTDGRNFQELERHDAAGTSSTRKEYSVTDKHPLVGRTYYRLKQVDLDGTTENFSMRFLDFSGKKGIVVFPNPLNDANDATLSLNFSSDEKAHVRITDLSGHEVWKSSFTGTNTLLPSGTAKGSYIVTVTTAGETYVTRFIVR
jgi:hypothetical protein